MPETRGDELFEIVDEAGRVLGTAPRRRCHGDPSLLHQSVHVMVFDGQRRLFLQRRSMQKDSQPGKWDSSVGGHMAPGEQPLESALRETQEELGFTPPALTFAYQYLWRTSFESELIRAYVVRHDGPFVLDPQEIDEGRFWTREEILAAMGKNLLTPQFEQEFQRLESWFDASSNDWKSDSDSAKPA